MSELTDLRADRDRLRRDNQRLRARLAKASNSPEVRRLRIEAQRGKIVRQRAVAVFQYEYPDGWQSIENQECRAKWKALKEAIDYEG